MPSGCAAGNRSCSRRCSTRGGRARPRDRRDAERIRRCDRGGVPPACWCGWPRWATGCQALAHAVAVLGARGEFRQARRLVGLDTDTACTAAAALSRAGSSAGPRRSFVHPLVRSAVLGDLPPPSARAGTPGRGAQAGDGATVTEIARTCSRRCPTGTPAPSSSCARPPRSPRAGGAGTRRALPCPRPDRAAGAGDTREVLFGSARSRPSSGQRQGIDQLREALDHAEGVALRGVDRAHPRRRARRSADGWRTRSRCSSAGSGSSATTPPSSEPGCRRRSPLPPAGSRPPSRFACETVRAAARPRGRGRAARSAAGTGSSRWRSRPPASKRELAVHHARRVLRLRARG